MNTTPDYILHLYLTSLSKFDFPVGISKCSLFKKKKTICWFWLKNENRPKLQLLFFIEQNVSVERRTACTYWH